MRSTGIVNGARNLCLAALLCLISAEAITAQTLRDTTGRHCAPLAYPRQLPALTLLLDSTAADSAVRALGFGARRFDVLVSIVFSDAGALHRVTLLDHDASLDSAIAVAVAVGRRVTPQDHAPNTWGVRLRITHDTVPVFRIERASYCEPRMKQWGGPRQREYAVRVSPGEMTSRFRIEFSVRGLVDTTGAVIKTEVQYVAGDRRVAEDYANDLLASRLEPALIDGVLVIAWYYNDTRCNGTGCRGGRR